MHLTVRFPGFLLSCCENRKHFLTVNYPFIFHTSTQMKQKKATFSQFRRKSAHNKPFGNILMNHLHLITAHDTPLIAFKVRLPSPFPNALKLLGVMFHYWETFYFKNWTYWYSRWNHKVVIDFKEIYIPRAFHSSIWLTTINAKIKPDLAIIIDSAS